MQSLTDHNAQGVTIHADRVGKTFRTRSGSTQAVKDVSFHVAPGEFVSLLGPSGCGKSTILNMLAGLIAPDQGRLTIDDASVNEPIDELGMVFQRDLLLEWRTVLDNVLLPIQIKRLSRKKHTERALELLRVVGLEEFVDSYPRELSGGMRQRVGICRALIHAPNLLLMDEPFAALDTLTREQLGVDLLRVHARYRPTVLFVTHSIDEAVLLSDRVLMLSQRPAELASTIEVRLNRPRDAATRRHPDFLRLVAEAREVMEASISPPPAVSS